MQSTIETPFARYEREDMDEALRVLHSGGVILYPTDTIWGLGCDATCSAAVGRIYSIKHRQDTKAMLCLLDGAGKLQGYMQEVPEQAYELIELATRPLTIIYPHAKGVAAELLGEDGSLGIRITREPFTHALCERLRHPLVSTSANLSGEPSPKVFKDIAVELKSEVDYIVRYRQDDTRESAPSSIIKLDVGGVIKIIRP